MSPKFRHLLWLVAVVLLLAIPLWGFWERGLVRGEDVAKATFFALIGLHVVHFINLSICGWGPGIEVSFPRYSRLPQHLDDLKKNPEYKIRGRGDGSFQTEILIFSISTIVLSFLLSFGINVVESSSDEEIASIFSNKFIYKTAISTLIILVTAEYGVVAAIGKSSPLMAKDHVAISLAIDLGAFFIIVAFSKLGIFEGVDNSQVNFSVVAFILVSIFVSVSTMLFARRVNRVHREVMAEILESIGLGPVELVSNDKFFFFGLFGGGDEGP